MRVVRNAARWLYLCLCAGFMFAAVDVMAQTGPGLSSSTLSDLAVKDVGVAQTVFDPNINGDDSVDLVLGKETVVITTVTLTAEVTTPTLTAETSYVPRFVSVVLREESTYNALAETWVDTSAIPEGGTGVELYYRPMSEGKKTLCVAVDPANSMPESSKANNQKPIETDSKLTKDLQLLYVPIDRPVGGVGYGPLAEMGQTVSRSNQFIMATYPVSELLFSGKALPTSFPGSPAASKEGIAADIADIATWGLLANPKVDKVIGVVPNDYFIFHGIPAWGGCSYVNGAAGLMTEGYWTAGAHELGHMYGIAKDEYSATTDGNPASGFWVSQRRAIGDSGIACFMGNTPLRTLDTRWVDKDDYNSLFQRLRISPVDPEVLLVAALLHSDGRVEMRPWYFLAEGNVTQSAPGDYAVRTVDASGHILSEVTMPVSFQMHAEPLGAVPTDVVPLVLAVPYSQELAAVQVTRASSVLATVPTTGKLLADAIAAIPDFGFEKKPDQCRKALYEKVKAIEGMLQHNANTGALQKLTHDLRPSVDRWLVDGYVKTKPVEMEKEEVLAAIDTMIEHVSGLSK